MKPFHENYINLKIIIPIFKKSCALQIGGSAKINTIILSVNHITPTEVFMATVSSGANFSLSCNIANKRAAGSRNDADSIVEILTKTKDP